MNFASGIPVLFGFVMYTGGPTAAFANWTMVGGLSFIVSLSMAEIAAALPTAGGIYYWSYRLGGPKWGYEIPMKDKRCLLILEQVLSCHG
jgi:amino acid transporter